MFKTNEIDSTDMSLFEVDQLLPIPDRDLSPEELEKLILDDIKSI